MDPLLAAAGITALGNYFGGLNAAGPEGSYVNPSDARFAYLNMQKFNPDSGAISALQQSKSRLAQMKAQRLGYIQQQYNQQRAAGGIGGHQLAGSLGLMGNQFAAMAEQELVLDKAIADQMDRTNQQRLQKYAAQQQAILTPSKDGDPKFGTLGQKVTNAFKSEGNQSQWNSLEDVVNWINSKYGDPQGTNSDPGENSGGGVNWTSGLNSLKQQYPDLWQAFVAQHPSGSSQSFINSPGAYAAFQTFIQQNQNSNSNNSGGNGGNDPFAALQQQYPDLWNMYLQSNPNFYTGISSPNMADFQAFINANNNGGGGNAGGDNGNPETLIPPAPPVYFVKDPIAPTKDGGFPVSTGAAPIISANDLVLPADTEGKSIVDPMVFPKYNQPKQKLNLPIDDNLLAMYKQGLLEM